MNDIKYLSIQEFRELGFLQEVNRQFLHPLGLALDVVALPDGTERLGGIWDYREDAEGMILASDMPIEIRRAKAESVEAERVKHMTARLILMGAVIQPLDFEAK